MFISFYKLFTIWLLLINIQKYSSRQFYGYLISLTKARFWYDYANKYTTYLFKYENRLITTWPDTEMARFQRNILYRFVVIKFFNLKVLTPIEIKAEIQRTQDYCSPVLRFQWWKTQLPNLVVFVRGQMMNAVVDVQKRVLPRI